MKTKTPLSVQRQNRADDYPAFVDFFLPKMPRDLDLLRDFSNEVRALKGDLDRSAISCLSSSASLYFSLWIL